MATNLVPVFAMLYAIISLLKWSMTVHFLTEPRIVVGCRPDERVEGVGDEAAAHHHHAHAAHAAALSVGGLEVDSCKVVHISGLQCCRRV